MTVSLIIFIELLYDTVVLSKTVIHEFLHIFLLFCVSKYLRDVFGIDR